MAAPVLTFGIKADTSQMVGEVKRAGAAIEGLGDSATKSADQAEKSEKKMLGLAKGLGLELSGAASAIVGKLEALRDHLIRTGAPAADLEKTTLALAEADRKYAASLSNTTKQMSVWEEHGTAMANTAGIMGAALFGFGVIAVKSFSESEAVLADLDAVLESTGDTSAKTKQQILGLAESLSKVTQFSDETIIRGETILKMFTNIGQDVFPRATRATLDLAQRMGMDVPAAAKLLGKALDQPGEGFSALAKQTGKFTDAQVAAIKEMAAMGKTGEAQAMVLDLVEKKVGGAAEAFGKTLTGQLAIARNEADEFNESVGGHLVPTLKDLVTEFPNVAKVAVGVHESWNKLNISGGELLIAVPLIKTAFAGMGASLLGMVGASGPIGLAILGIAALTTTVYLAITAIQAFSDKQIAVVNANINATRATAALTKEAAQYGIQLQKGNETQEQFNARLFQSITAYEKLHPEVKKAQASTVQHASETNKLDAVLKTAGASTQKLGSEMKKLETQYASTTGKIVLEIAAIQQDIKFMEQHRGSAEALTGAKEKLGRKTLELIAAQSGHKEILEKTTVALQETTVKALGQMTAVEMLEIAWKDYIDRLNAGAKAMLAIPFDPIISNVDTLNEAIKRADEGAASWEKLNEMIKVKTPEALKPAEQGFKDLGRQVSTVVTDLGKGIADALIKWQGFGKSMVNIAKEFGSGILRTMIETWFKPLEDLLQKVTKKLTDVLGGALKSIGGGIGKLFGADGLLGGLLSGGIMAGIGVGISALVGKFTQRGRDKTTATGGAQEVSANVWGTVADVKAGNMSVEEGIAAVNQAWVNYEKFLRENLKDQTVIQRSLDTQRGTLTQSLAELESIRQSMDAEMKKLKTEEAVANLQKLGAQFLETGQMSEEFAKAVTDAGGSVDFFNKMAGEVERLQGLRKELGSLKQMIDSLLPPTKTWQQRFFETGEITEEMAEKIREAGGDINQFKKFADMKGVKTQFESLVEEFEKTGEASDKLLEMIKEFGGDDALKAFEDLRAEAKASGKTIGELAKDSEGSAKIIQGALESTAGGINKAFGDAAKSLSDTLAKMDENLGKAISDLQTAMVVMIQNLIEVILGVPGAAEKAARDANFFLGGIKAPEIRIQISTHFDDSGLREAEARAARLRDMGFTPQPGIDQTTVNSGGGGRTDQAAIDPRIPRFQHGTEYVPRTGLAMLHQGEAVIPASQNKSGTGSANITFNISGTDPRGLKEMVQTEIAPYLVDMLKNNRSGLKDTLQGQLGVKR